jgi:hypothetical protein
MFQPLRGSRTVLHLTEAPGPRPTLKGAGGGPFADKAKDTEMFVTVLAIAMAAFALGTWIVARRRGLSDGIARRPYHNAYTDAPAARRLPNAGRARVERPFWARPRRDAQPQES